MIGSLRGTLLERTGLGEVLVEVAGVGYRVTVTPSTQVAVGEPGTEVFLHVHHHVREDAQVLYGFLTGEERRTFEALLGAHGVGPSLALAILSVHDPAALYRVVAEDDVAALCLVPKVGRKTAARLLIELKSRLDLPEGATPVGPTTNGAGAAGGSTRADVRHALVELGYGPDEIAEVTGELADADNTDPSALLKRALRALGAQR